MLVVWPSRSALITGTAGNLAVFGVWLASRTVGVPFVNGGVPEAVAFVDLVCATVEVAFVVGAAALLAGWAPSRASRLGPAGVAAIVGTLALTTVALASPSSEHDHADSTTGTGHDHSADAVVATASSADAPAAGPHHHGECTDPVTPDQQAVADRFIATSDATVAKYRDLSVAQAEGWQPITPPDGKVVHYALADRIADGRVLDPTAPESLVYAFGGPQRTPYFLGAMYLMEGTGDPPDPGGCAMVWHNHENLCLAPGKGMVGVVASDGSCPDGAENAPTTYMLHAWSIPMPGGPFSEIDPQAVRQAVTEAFG